MSKCTITWKEFEQNEKAVVSAVSKAIASELYVKRFGTGSFGLYCNSKPEVKIGNHTVRFQVGALTVIGSKDAPVSASEVTVDAS
jgi:hypothetical protein